MKRLTKLWTGAALAVAAAGYVAADTSLVSYPAGFETDFVRYTVIDRPDRNIARFMYMSADAWEAASADAPLPHGTIIVMEDHKIRMIDDETPVTDAAGNFIPTDETTNVFVMEKRTGWGADYSEEMRNGEWEYAWFMADGTRSERPMTRCFECHKSVEDSDFTYTTYPALKDLR